MREQQNWERLWNLRCDLDRLMRYHGKRLIWLDGASRWASFSGLFFSTAAFATLVGSISDGLPLAKYLLAATTALAALASLAERAFEFSATARKHSDLLRQYSMLYKDADSEIDYNEKQISDFYRRYYDIQINEMPIYYVVEAESYNDMLQYLGNTTHPRRKISYWQNRTKHVFPWAPSRIDNTSYPENKSLTQVQGNHDTALSSADLVKANSGR